MITQQRGKIGAVGILGIIAAVCAAAMVIMILLCLPYFDSGTPDEVFHVKNVEEEDPLKVQHSEPATEPGTEETTEPTIPPEKNPYDRLDFQYNENNYLQLLTGNSVSGIDVSSFQGEIDWQQVKASGIDFAIIRLGYRGYETGKMVEDETAKKNLEGAREAGLEVGVYFFSQALSKKEVEEEIDFMLKVMGDFKPDLPVVFDWEYISAEARTGSMDARTLTDCSLHFCQIMEKKGYTPMVYFNWYQGDHFLYLHELEEYPFWLALYQDRMTYPYKIEMWQYTNSGKVPGITGDVDINVMFKH